MVEIIASVLVCVALPSPAYEIFQTTSRFKHTEKYTMDEVRLHHTSGKNLVSQDISFSLPNISIGKQTAPSNANDELSPYLEA